MRRAHESSSWRKIPISLSKRYVGFRGDPRNPQIIKPSQHGVGCYFKPDKRKWIKPRDCANNEKYPALAFDDWEHILKQHFSDYAAHADGCHPFLNHLAMRKVRVNTPRELAALRKLDPDKARPFNFCISPVLVENPFRPKQVLITSFNLHPEQWPKLKVIEKLKGRFSIKQLARKARLDRDVIRPAFRGKLIQLRSWRLLMRVYEDRQCLRPKGRVIVGRKEDGKSVYYVNTEQPERIWRMPIDGGRLTLLLTFSTILSLNSTT